MNHAKYRPAKEYSVAVHVCGGEDDDVFDAVESILYFKDHGDEPMPVDPLGRFTPEQARERGCTALRIAGTNTVEEVEAMLAMAPIDSDMWSLLKAAVILRGLPQMQINAAKEAINGNH